MRSVDIDKYINLTLQHKEIWVHKWVHAQHSSKLAYHFGVDAVNSKQQGCKYRPLRLSTKNHLAYKEKENWGNAVHEYIHQVIAEGTQLGEIVVEVTVGEHRKGAVWFVTLNSRHAPAPKVVLEKFPNRCFLWVEVIVGQNGSVVVEYETSI